MVAAICSRLGCDQAIHISIGRWPGGVNDRGGFVIECTNCGHRSYIAVSNPKDASSVTSGGRIIATWDEDAEELDEVLDTYGLTFADKLQDNMLVIPSSESDDPQFALEERSIYRCLECDGELERAAYDELGKVLDAINQRLWTHFNCFLKGRHRVPDTIEISLDVACACTSYPMVFHGPFSEANPIVKDVSEFMLAGPHDPTMLSDIDGVYSRDDCIEIFKKLLLRWRARHCVVMLVVPFIGLDYRGREENRVDLWSMVLGHTNPDRTLLVTRRATYNGFVEAARSQGIDIDALAKFNLLTPMVSDLAKKGALFKQQSHAKFYAAVGRDRTEVLSGSFNIHTGKYVENLLFKTYATKDFLTRYLLPLEVVYNPNLLNTERAVFAIEIENGQIKSITTRTDT